MGGSRVLVPWWLDGDRGGVFNAVAANLSAAEGGEVAASAEGFADVFAESADVGAAGDLAADSEVGPGVVEDL